MVACLGGNSDVLGHLDRGVAHLRWHSGKPADYHRGSFHVVSLSEDRDGPFVQVGPARIIVVHGSAAEPIATLQRQWGRFAAFEWDGTLLRVCRDPMGEVPLFYRKVHAAIWFATEIHPLVALGEAVPDLDALSAFVGWVEFPERTGWMGIHRVLPGETLEVDTNLQPRASRYWLPASHVGRSSLARKDVPDRFRELFESAVKRRLTPGSGVLLSGGLDSSAVALVSARLASSSLISLRYGTLPNLDESRFALAVAHAAGMPLDSVEGLLDPWDPQEALTTYGVPPVSLPTGAYETLLPHAASLGCEAVLDGHDGDTVLGPPYSALANTLLDGRVGLWAEAAREYGWKWTLRETAKEFLPPSARRILVNRPVGETIAEQFGPSFTGHIKTRILRKYCWRTPRSGWLHQQFELLESPWTQVFEENEMLGARFGIDIRHPFADRDLITFMLGLPHAVKGSPTRTKPILRDALSDLLPPLVRDRSDKVRFDEAVDRRVDYAKCFQWVRESGIRLPHVDYDRLFVDARSPNNNRILWIRLASAHIFAAGGTT
jgi:asparagine synthase (glutamine-hydrolysing)